MALQRNGTTSNGAIQGRMTSQGSESEGYTLAIVGCGTMGIAVMSGMLESKRANEAKRAATAALHSSSSSTSLNGTLNDLSSSIASLLEIDDGKNNSGEGSSQRKNGMQLPSKFIACVSRIESAKKLRKTFEEFSTSEDIEVLARNNLKAAKKADVVILACKPQMVKDVLAEEGIKEALQGKLVCSICAGLTIKSIRQCLLEDTTVVRAMPNTPAKIREGMTILTPLPQDDEEHIISRNRLICIFSAIGKCRVLDEKHFDVATALAGSGPAFACVFLEAMVDGAVMMGMPRKEALELAAQTMQGAARMVIQSGMHPAAIKDSVTTPGGCTIAGLLTLEDGRLRSTVARTIQAAAEHASGLGK